MNTSDRNLLRYYYVTDLTLAQIAGITGVKHNTVSRRLAKIRGNLLMGTRNRLIEIAGIRDTEFESVVRLVQSQLNVSMYRMLGSDTDDSQDDD
jgi:DNA-binding transcriptional regulator LsrR (DeoR family)